MSGNKNDWTWDDYDKLYKNYGVIPTEELAKQLGRTPISTCLHAEKLLLFSSEGATLEEYRFLKQYGKHLKQAAVFFIPDRSVNALEEMIKCIDSARSC